MMVLCSVIPMKHVTSTGKVFLLLNLNIIQSGPDMPNAHMKTYSMSICVFFMVNLFAVQKTGYGFQKKCVQCQCR